MIADKTKAALQGRQCRRTELTQGQDSTLIGLVNAVKVIMCESQTPETALASGKGCSNVSNGQSRCSVSKTFSQAGRSKSCLLLPHAENEEEHDLKITSAIITAANAKTIFFITYPFGSMPELRSLSRQASLTQALNCPGPASESICCKSESSKRIFFFVLPERSKVGLIILSCIGTYQYYRMKPNGTYRDVFVQPLNTAKPGSVTSTNGPLTTTVRTSNEAAMKDHTTHPQGRHFYTWRFLALNRHDKNATPCRLSVEAPTEREARRILAPHFILSLAARLPLQEVHHA